MMNEYYLHHHKLIFWILERDISIPMACENGNNGMEIEIIGRKFQRSKSFGRHWPPYFDASQRTVERAQLVSIKINTRITDLWIRVPYRSQLWCQYLNHRRDYSMSHCPLVGIYLAVIFDDKQQQQTLYFSNPGHIKYSIYNFER